MALSVNLFNESVWHSESASMALSVNLFNEPVWHSESASMMLSVDLFNESVQHSESASMAFNSQHLPFFYTFTTVQSICVTESMSCDQSLS